MKLTELLTEAKSAKGYDIKVAIREALKDSDTPIREMDIAKALNSFYLSQETEKKTFLHDTVFYKLKQNRDGKFILYRDKTLSPRITDFMQVPMNNAPMSLKDFKDKYLFGTDARISVGTVIAYKIKLTGEELKEICQDTLSGFVLYTQHDKYIEYENTLAQAILDNYFTGKKTDLKEHMIYTVETRRCGVPVVLRVKEEVFSGEEESKCKNK